ncbi:hypothetical protein C8D90_10862 [Enterobacillus tribolii]|uniref:Uncharacterized protein n=1 Tax=Enterobacillus tribolii TaxID=1487935 RepID=A0A370QHG4_9GAMM|nr:hypothetical protein C8D90_10862 [Enterobacillus tribolii]
MGNKLIVGTLFLMTLGGVAGVILAGIIIYVHS